MRSTLSSRLKDRVGVEAYRHVCSQVLAQRYNQFGYESIAESLPGITVGEVRSVERELKRMLGANYEAHQFRALEAAIVQLPWLGKP